MIDNIPEWQVLYNEVVEAFGDDWLATPEPVREYIKVMEQLLYDAQSVVKLIPECPEHGYCCPHASEWVIAARKDNE